MNYEEFFKKAAEIKLGAKAQRVGYVRDGSVGFGQLVHCGFRFFTDDKLGKWLGW